jgi:hypothetical protein
LSGFEQAAFGAPETAKTPRGGLGWLLSQLGRGRRDGVPASEDEHWTVVTTSFLVRRAKGAKGKG